MRRSATPFGINATLALAAVAGGMLLPQYLGTLAGRLLAMQSLVVFAVAMLCGFTAARRQSLAEGKQGYAQALTVALWFLCAGFLLGAWNIGGAFGLVEFTVLAGGTFLGAWHEQHGRRELLQIGVRCAVAFIALVVAASAFSLPERVWTWPGASGSVAAAGLYFGALAAAEAMPRFYWRLVVRMRWLILAQRRRPARSNGSKGQ